MAMHVYRGFIIHIICSLQFSSDSKISILSIQNFNWESYHLFYERKKKSMKFEQNVFIAKKFIYNKQCETSLVF